MVRITEGALAEEEAAGEVAGVDHGAVVTFSGRVRRMEGDREIRAIRYEAHGPMALKGLERIAAAALERWGARLAIHHRVGRVPAGEASLVIAAAAPHRREAFEACSFAIEALKKDVQIWKTDYEPADPS